MSPLLGKGYIVGKILLVDDDQSLRCVVEFILVEAGHDVHQATCGAVAVLKYDQIQPDLVLTDMRMAPGDGFHVLHHVQTTCACPPVPVIMFTAFDTPAQRLQANEMGVFALLTKPCRKDLLCLTVEQALRGIEAVEDQES